jgi:hypothetical protein
VPVRAAGVTLALGVPYQDLRWLAITRVGVAWCLPFILTAVALVDLLAGWSAGLLFQEVFVLALASGLLWQRRPSMGFTLTGDAIELRGALRNRSVALDQISGVGIGRDIGVVIARFEGAPVRMPTLVHLTRGSRLERRLGSGCVRCGSIVLTQDDTIRALNDCLRRHQAAA